MGDAILDNYAGLNNSDNDLKWELEERGYKVKNAACDGCTLSNLSKGNMIPKKNGYDVDSNSRLDQFRILDIGNKEQGKKVPTVVLSIGGSDMKNKSISFVLGAKAFIENLLTNSFIKSYEEIIERILDKTPNLILTVLFEPCIANGSPYGIFANQLDFVYSEWRKFILSIATKYDLPVIDLSCTLNKNNRSHYGKNYTCMSDKSNKLFSKMIKYVCENYQGKVVYFAPDCDTKTIKKYKIKN